ncbi:MAG: CpaD family pilus assembly protein [Pseudaminobacter sp.]|nr:CpaD family pilus assembly protein [Pseudaminobacter sp.]
MSDAALNTTANAAQERAGHSLHYRPALLALAVTSAILLSGCAMAPRDSVIVGSIPDDYRTNHPIVIAEKDQVIDIPVGAGDRGMSEVQRVALMGFFDDYDRSAAPLVSIMVPSGSINELGASHASRDFVQLAKASGIPKSSIEITSYQSPAAAAAPIRVVYTTMSAQTGKCGRWPGDVLETTDNKHYANFGCSYQNNLAAQLANPADLLGPRKQTTIDAERRGLVIDGYRDVPFFSPTPRREVEY